MVTKERLNFIFSSPLTDDEFPARRGLFSLIFAAWLPPTEYQGKDASAANWAGKAKK